MSYFSNISGLTADLLLIGAVFIIFLLFSFYFGKSRLVSIILAYYPAVLIYNNFPFINSMLVLKGESLLVLNKFLIFAVIITILSIAIGRFIFSESGYGGSHIWRHIGFALGTTILSLVFVHSVINIDFIHKFSPTIEALFGTSSNIFWWEIAPIIILFVL